MFLSRRFDRWGDADRPFQLRPLLPALDPTVRAALADPLVLADHKLARPESRLLVAEWQARSAGAPREDAKAIVLIVQWPEGAGPPPPALRLARALAEMALDFAAIAPQAVRTGAAGHKVLVAVADVASRVVLPDLDSPAGWDANRTVNGFVQSLLVAAFRAGLETVADTPGSRLRPGLQS